MADSSDIQRYLAWGITAAVIVAGGLTLHLSRDALAERLDLLPDLANLAPAEEEVATNAVAEAPPPPAEPEVAPPAGPQLSYVEVQVMLAPMIQRTLDLITDGRQELPDYADIGSDDESKANRARRFFQTWSTTWTNRVGVLEKDTPPTEECAPHADLERVCVMLRGVYGLLLAVPEMTDAEDGVARLDEADQAIDLFLNPPEAEEEEGIEDGEDGETTQDDA